MSDYDTMSGETMGHVERKASAVVKKLSFIVQPTLFNFSGAGQRTPLKLMTFYRRVCAFLPPSLREAYLSHTPLEPDARQLMSALMKAAPWEDDGLAQVARDVVREIYTAGQANERETMLRYCKDDFHRCVRARMEYVPHTMPYHAAVKTPAQHRRWLSALLERKPCRENMGYVPGDHMAHIVRTFIGNSAHNRLDEYIRASGPKYHRTGYITTVVDRGPMTLKGIAGGAESAGLLARGLVMVHRHVADGFQESGRDGPYGMHDFPPPYLLACVPSEKQAMAEHYWLRIMKIVPEQLLLLLLMGDAEERAAIRDAVVSHDAAYADCPLTGVLLYSAGRIPEASWDTIPPEGGHVLAEMGMPWATPDWVRRGRNKETLSSIF